LRRKPIAILLVLIFSIATLSACGGGDVVDANHPALGKWTATTVSMMGFSMDPDEILTSGETTVELKANGSCVVVIDGKKGNAKWTIDGDTINIKGGGATLEGSISNGVLNLEEASLGMTLSYKK